MDNSSVRYVGPGFLTLLGVVFITLKLLGTITWSWWLVLLPLYGPWIVIVAIALSLWIIYLTMKSWN